MCLRSAFLLFLSLDGSTQLTASILTDGQQHYMQSPSPWEGRKDSTCVPANISFRKQTFTNFILFIPVYVYIYSLSSNVRLSCSFTFSFYSYLLPFHYFHHKFVHNKCFSLCLYSPLVFTKGLAKMSACLPYLFTVCK